MDKVINLFDENCSIFKYWNSIDLYLQESAEQLNKKLNITDFVTKVMLCLTIMNYIHNTLTERSAISSTLTII